MKILAATLVAVLVAASCGEGVDAGAQLEANDPFTWRPLPVAPIADRPYAVAGWSGTEAVFWAGSNLRRDFAHTDGAAYDPATDSWRRLSVPGWGHPGLTGAVFGGALYVAAKGGTTRIDLTSGADDELPQVSGFVPATMVATGDALWALGPVNFAEGEAVRVGIARFRPEVEAWDPGPTFAGAPELGPLFQDLLFVDQPVVWTGADVVVWAGDGHGLAFDPDREEWRLLPALVPPRGTIEDSRVVAAGSGLAVLAAVEGGGAPYGVASWDGEEWSWQDVTADFGEFETVTAAGAGDWLFVFGWGRPPHSVHVGTGTVVGHDGTPLDGVQAPNAVWTGSELVAWGGAGPEPGSQSEGVVWVLRGS